MNTEREVATVQNESTFEDFLVEDGALDEVDAIALKRVIVWKLEDKMKSEGISKKRMAEVMSTSRPQIDRLLDPENIRVQLDTVMRASRALGLKMSVKFEDADTSSLMPAEVD
ncbi:XRE family transcriptional regulator [Gluconobacter aidae]|uniref:Fis family transcriptional regulator n=1 Tax=Gluconobacter aidae TaxID=2662454 RepID=A0A7X1VPT2_9PROT|nr:XRE family transcriptional regulator [Gluconobacter aidae]MQS00182.1 Fis family transcriptional regulator [Gluconobacter aidae]